MIVTKMKSLGVTSVVMFTDIGMTTAVLAAATKQDYRPEWIITGNQFDDVVFLARNYDQDQWAHAFGISTVRAVRRRRLDAHDSGRVVLGPQPGHGPGRGRHVVALVLRRGAGRRTEVDGQDVSAGPVRRPAQGGAATGDPTGGQTAFGRTAGLPYDEYMQLGTDFAPVWYDQDTVDISNIFPISGKGVEWYVNGARRYAAGQWPTKPFTFFDKTGGGREVHDTTGAARREPVHRVSERRRRRHAEPSLILTECPFTRQDIVKLAGGRGAVGVVADGCVVRGLVAGPVLICGDTTWFPGRGGTGFDRRDPWPRYRVSCAHRPAAARRIRTSRR